MKNGEISFSGTSYICDLARKQIELYRVQPAEAASHFNREQAALDSYRGRQLLELLQNADDACENFNGEKKLLFRLTEEYLIIANTGHPFTKQGIESLVISDNSPKQLKRTRYIGNKGLGFRAVLSWCRSPIVISGDFLVAFSATHAKNSVKSLASEIRELQALLNDWNAAGRGCPASIMRFPFIPDLSHDHVKLALDVIREGYNTVIFLPLPLSLQQKEIHADITAQLHSISGEIAIFCYNLEKIILQGDIEQAWELIREKHDDKQKLIIYDGHTDKMWTVYRKESRLPEELLSSELRRTPEFELTIAVPEEIPARKNHKLCVYFSTNEVLPMALLCHASLDTDDSRNRLVKHNANEYVLKMLGEFVVEIAEKETTKENPYRGLELMAGIEKCDPELADMGLRDTIIKACKHSKLFYRLDGSFATAGEINYPPNPIWYDIVTEDYFPEILRLPKNIDARSFLDILHIPWYDDQTISQRLEMFIKALPPQRAGTHVGKLMISKQIPRSPLPSLLIGESETVLSLKQTAFIPAESETMKLPAWVENFTFLDRKFIESVKNETSAQSVRDLRNHFSNLGYIVEEFQLESVARQLTDEATKKGEESPEKKLSFYRDLLRYIYEMAQKQGDIESPIRTPLNVITTKGTWQKAEDCYFGPDYPSGRFVFDLYNQLGKDEFVAAPSVLGLDGDINSIEVFLSRIGIARSPRITKVNDKEIKSTRLYSFIDYVVDRLEFPNRYFGREVSSSEELRRNFRGFTVNDLSIPDRFPDILERTDPVFIIKLLATDGSFIFQELDPGAVFYAKTGNERKAWPYNKVPVPNIALYLLKNHSWVPCEDGQKRRPNQIILSRVGGKVLQGTFFNYKIDLSHPSIKEIGGRSSIESIFLRLGATYSLESLKPDDLYSMLLNLPNSDPKGQIAPSIYRTLIEQGGIETESYLREKFFREGLMWGRQGNIEKYFPVNELKYLSQAVVPKAVLKEIPLVDIDLRRSSSEIKRIFNVHPLRREDVSIQLDNEATEYQLWSAEAWRHVKRAHPFLYAFRLSKTVDETGKERRLFKKISFNVCSRLGAIIALFGGRESSIVIDDDAEGLVIDTAMFLVSHNTEFSIGDQVFLLAIGDLFSDILGINISSDFAGFFGCDTEQQMLKLLEKKVGREAGEFLSKAKTALEEGDEEISGETVIVPPPRFMEKHDETEETDLLPWGEVSTKEFTGDLLPEDAGFKPVEPPTRVQGPKKKLVVTGKTVAPRSPRKKTVMVDESISLKIVELFEKSAERYPIRVEHIKGTEALGCDIVSVASDETKKLVEEGHELNLADVLRFIEVKGRSNRTGLIELTENQLSAAETFKDRFFLYRVFRDPGDPSHFELAVLINPSDSNAKKVIRTTQFDLSAGSGAEWFQVVEQEEG